MTDTSTSPSTGAENVPLRGVAAALLVIATLAHLVAALSVRPVFVVLFVLSALGTAAAAALLIRTPRLGWLVGGTVSLLTALGYIQRSTIGFFGLLPPEPFLRPVAGPVSAIAELLVVVLAVVALRHRTTLTRATLTAELTHLLPGRTHGRRATRS